MNNTNEITCAIWMVTYNHQDYIEQSIQSVLNQKTNFRYKIFIGEDNSSDATAELCISMAAKYPDKIKLVLNEKNLGPNTNAQNIFALCFNSGAKYIAMCEGDDYWIDKNKLQKQVDILESNNNCSFCFHRALRIFDTARRYEIYPDLDNNIINSPQFFALSTIPMASMLFRNKINFWFPANHIQPDFLILCKLMSNGFAYFLPEVMSVYRKHVGGISYNNQSYNYLKRRVECLHIEAKSNEFSRDVKREIKRMFKSHTRQLMSQYKNQLSLSCVLKYRYWLLTA